MRAIFFVIVATLLAGCATTPATNTTNVHDQKYNTTRYVAKQANSEFVGTSATGLPKRSPAGTNLGSKL